MHNPGMTVGAVVRLVVTFHDPLHMIDVSFRVSVMLESCYPSFQRPME